ncbi:MAG: hypothetical protein ACRDRS_22585 [Pseudonocardiaceae bacterium]
MTHTERRPGADNRGNVDDQHRAHEVSSESSRRRCRSWSCEIDPDGVPPYERARRAEAVRKAHMRRLALASAKARSARKSAGEASPP